MNVIEVNNVSKKFRLGAMGGDLRERFSNLFARRSPEEKASKDFWALRDISFEVAEGESFGIIGHNGSGKSTLLKLITGIYTPTSGTFKTRGRISALIEVGAGFHPDLTGRENVYMNGSVLGLKKREIDKKFDDIVAFAELEQFIDTPVKRYSSGMYMRLGFAVAAHVDPDIVLVDEVLAVGDESFQRKCMNKMLELRQNGKTILFISHAMPAVTQLCNTVMLLSHGKQIGVGDPLELISIYRTMSALDNSHRMDGASPSALPTREAEILEVRLLDQQGFTCDQIASGDGVTVEITCRVHMSIAKPVFGMSIFREDGLQVYGFNTQYDNVDVQPLDIGERTYRVTFPSLPLISGQYFISTDITHTDNHTSGVFPIIDVRDKVLCLEVRNRTRNIGLVDLPHTWQFDTISYNHTVTHDQSQNNASIAIA